MDKHYLMEKGVDCKLITLLGENAIHLSIESECDTILDFLLQLGINPNLADIDGNTPLLVAKNNQILMAEKLIDYGADIIIENSTHHTPIFYAIENEDTLNFNKLIEKGAKIDVSANYVPPIFLAASKENKYFVEKLLINGAEYPTEFNVHDICYKIAFIYSVSAGIAHESEKLGLYQNSLFIYNLAKKKYMNELSDIRSRNTVHRAGQGCLIFADILSSGDLDTG